LFSNISTVIFSANNSIILNKLQFVSITITSTGIANFYIGDLDNAPTISGTANQDSGTPTAGTTNVIIGNRVAQDRTFDGTIPMIRVYEGILTLEEITQIWSVTKKKLK